MTEGRDHAFQRAQERRAMRNEELALYRTPAVERGNIAEQGATELAKTVLQIGLILNGGGIIALPAVAGLLGDSSKPLLSDFVHSGIIFIIGLLISCLANILAYFAICCRGQYYEEEEKEWTWHIMGTFSENENMREEHMAESKSHFKQKVHANKSYIRLRLTVVTLCTVSVIAFAAGSILSGWALVTKVREEVSVQQTVFGSDRLI
jgi:hypothetical protein